jgi:hypothetical protein
MNHFSRDPVVPSVQAVEREIGTGPQEISRTLVEIHVATLKVVHDVEFIRDNGLLQFGEGHLIAWLKAGRIDEYSNVMREASVLGREWWSIYVRPVRSTQGREALVSSLSSMRILVEMGIKNAFQGAVSDASKQSPTFNLIPFAASPRVVVTWISILRAIKLKQVQCPDYSIDFAPSPSSLCVQF